MANERLTRGAIDRIIQDMKTEGDFESVDFGLRDSAAESSGQRTDERDELDCTVYDPQQTSNWFWWNEFLSRST